MRSKQKWEMSPLWVTGAVCAGSIRWADNDKFHHSKPGAFQHHKTSILFIEKEVRSI